MDTPAPDLDRFTSRRSTVYGARGVVATSQPLAAEAGVELLRQGGNAFDAAVATAAALNVVEPTSTGLGGDVFACYRTADGDVGAMRSCGAAPADATRGRVREAVDGDAMPLRGPHTVTVPGAARGWELTADEFGRFGLGELLSPAIRYAREGYPVSEVVADQWAGAGDLFDDEGAREAWLFDGEPPAAGQRVRLPALGATLERVAEAGADVVYEGEVARAIADEVQATGGFLSVEDLAAFEPELVDPARATYRGVEVFELPPNNQGLIALEALRIAAELRVDERPFDSPAYTHYLVEAFKRAFHDGHRYIADPEYESVPPLTASEWVERRAATVGERAGDVAAGRGRPGEDADTVLCCVADEDGNVVSYINSRFKGFGSGLVAGDTGIALQNRGAAFSLDPDHPNRLEPGKRPFHTLVPAVARLGGDDWAAFGVMGGAMQPQGHLQVLTNLVDGELPLQAALDRPRWRYYEDGTLAVEDRMARLGTKLARRDHDVRLLPPSEFGGAQVVRSDAGVLSGATEPRKDGTVAGY